MKHFKRIEITNYINDNIKKDKFDEYSEIYIKSVFYNLLSRIDPDNKIKLSVEYKEINDPDLKFYCIRFNDRDYINLSNKTYTAELIETLIYILPILIDDLYIEM